MLNPPTVHCARCLHGRRATEATSQAAAAAAACVAAAEGPGTLFDANGPHHALGADWGSDALAQVGAYAQPGMLWRRLQVQ